jgi:hypothetical protein
MTDRVQGFTVVLDRDVRDDDVEELRKAIACLRYVVSVENRVVVPDDHWARQRMRYELIAAIGDAINAFRDGKTPNGPL